MSLVRRIKRLFDLKKQKPLSPTKVEYEQNVKYAWIYLRNTLDGQTTILLSVIYFSWASYLTIREIFELSNVAWNFILGLFLMPILFIVILLRHRMGTVIADMTPVIPCILSNLAMALLPIYFIWK